MLHNRGIYDRSCKIGRGRIKSKTEGVEEKQIKRGEEKKENWI